MDLKTIEKLATGDRVFTFSTDVLHRAQGDISLINGPDKIVEAIFLRYRKMEVDGENPRSYLADANDGDVFHMAPFFIFASREDARGAVLKAIIAKLVYFTERRGRWLGAKKDTSGETV